MPECRKCKVTLVWKQPYKAGDRPVNTNGSKHLCGGLLMQSLEVWKKKWETTYQYECPIYCYACDKKYKYDDICIHMKSHGFREGIDTVTFYSDKWSAVKRREYLKQKTYKEDTI